MTDMLSGEHAGLPSWLSDIGCYLILLSFILGMIANQTSAKAKKYRKFQITVLIGMIMCACFITSAVLDYLLPRTLDYIWYVYKICLFSAIFLLLLVCFLKGIFSKEKG